MKYIQSHFFEFNRIGEVIIAFSQNLTEVYQMNCLEAYIVSLFVTPTTKEESLSVVSKIEGFNPQEYDKFFQDLVDKKIIEIAYE